MEQVGSAACWREAALSHTPPPPGEHTAPPSTPPPATPVCGGPQSCPSISSSVVRTHTHTHTHTHKETHTYITYTHSDMRTVKCTHQNSHTYTLPHAQGACGLPVSANEFGQSQHLTVLFKGFLFLSQRAFR